MKEQSQDPGKFRSQMPYKPFCLTGEKTHAN
jgi:hypothetical protein